MQTQAAKSEGTARLLIVPATSEIGKVTVTIMGPEGSDRARVIRVLASLLSDGSEWDAPMPNVELIGGGPVPHPEA